MKINVAKTKFLICFSGNLEYIPMFLRMVHQLNVLMPSLFGNGCQA